MTRRDRVKPTWFRRPSFMCFFRGSNEKEIPSHGADNANTGKNTDSGPIVEAQFLGFAVDVPVVRAAVNAVGGECASGRGDEHGRWEN